MGTVRKIQALPSSMAKGRKNSCEPVDHRHQGRGADPDPHPDQGRDRQKSAHLTLGEDTDRRQLPDAVEGPGSPGQGIRRPRQSS